MAGKSIAKSEISINASPSKVWEALTNSRILKKLMFGAEVVTDWKEGSPIVYKGIWQGKVFEDKGTIVTFQPEKLLVTTHFSPLSGAEDIPQNYHRIRYELIPKNSTTYVVLTQDNNGSEQERTQAEDNWNMMLENLKKIVENETKQN